MIRKYNYRTGRDIADNPRNDDALEVALSEQAVLEEASRIADRDSGRRSFLERVGTQLAQEVLLKNRPAQIDTHEVGQ
jgi:hypothetical protein